MTLALAGDLVGIPRAGRELLRPFGFHHFVEHQGGASASDSIYRYHPLFRAFLLRRGQQTEPISLLQPWLRTTAAPPLSNGRSAEGITLFPKAFHCEQTANCFLTEETAPVAR